MFDTVLVANRGEIACRIMSTLRRLGVRAVAVYSDADAAARHVRLADTAVRLGPAPAAQSYLDIVAVIDAARRTGVQAIHPGYGFLSENARFAAACEAAGIVFVGPPTAAIATMGDKISARAAVEARGVPTVPGLARHGLGDDDLIAAADDIGYPVLVKPSAGGGGKGMRVVHDPAELPAALASSRREAAGSFGDDTLFLERFVSAPRHIEVQVLADAHGSVIHLGERECSLQRRHQKVIEEAPSPLLDGDTRRRIGEAACETARSVAYRGAGTVEFIVSSDRPDEFFFMEMNTRLQVEHPVTEQITGVDLVEEQLRVAAGEPLRYEQDDIRLDGHSFEARVYAEDPAAGFLPTGGTVARVTHPAGEGIRVDTALEDGLEVTSDYDPLLAKIVSWAPDRDAARRRLHRALIDTAILGVTTNVGFLARLLEQPAVVSGDLDTAVIERVLPALAPPPLSMRAIVEGALAFVATEPATGSGAWARGDGWRLGAFAPRRLRLAGDDAVVHDVRVWGVADDASVSIDGAAPIAAAIELDGSAASSVVDGVRRSFAVVVSGDRVDLSDRGDTVTVQRVSAERREADDADATPHLVSPMPGVVVMIAATDGQPVAVGDPVLAVEAMKMEHALTATVAGRVTVHAALGDHVARGQVVASIVPEPSG